MAEEAPPPLGLSITLFGVPITSFSREIRANLPQGRYNYFDVPWNAGCPGTGRVLVTTEQLEAIIAADPGTAGGELILDHAPKGNEPTLIFPKVILVKADPLFGHVINELGAPGSDPVSKGVWCLEIQDARNGLNTSIISGQMTAWNVLKGNFDGNEYVETTAKSETLPYNFEELVQQVSGIFPVNAIMPDDLKTNLLEDVYVSGLPLGVCLDLMLNATFWNCVWRYDPTDPDFKIEASKLDKDYSQLIFDHAREQIGGGYSKTFSGYEGSNALGVGYFQDNGRPVNADFSDYIVGNGPLVYGTKRRFPTLTQTHRSRKQFHGLFHGFIKDFIKRDYPITLTVYSWSSGIPTTEVHIGGTTPVRTLLEGPTGHFVRDRPDRVSINGDIGLPLRGGGRSGFRGTITLCNHNESWAMVTPGGGGAPIRCDLPNQCWPEKGDPVYVSPVGSSDWVVLEHIPIREVPPAGAVLVSGPPRNVCTDIEP